MFSYEVPPGPTLWGNKVDIGQINFETENLLFILRDTMWRNGTYTDLVI